MHRFLFFLLSPVIAVTSYAQQALPDGPGRDTLKRVCSPCHSAENVIGHEKTAEEWGRTVGEMATFGAQATEDEFDEIADYLAKNFPKQTNGPKVNVSTAAVKDLETGLQFSAKEAEAIVRYREQNGKFKSIAELKKVPGIDVKKIDEKKERIVF